MSVVGELSVVITADADGVKKAVTASSAALKQGSVQLRKSVNDWGKWAAAAVAASAAVASAVVKSQLSSIKEIKNLADASNTSVAEFQRGAFAADTVGISMEKYGDILKDVTERVGEFSSIGSGPMIDFFENVAPKVGVTADMFKELSGQDALGLYVKSLEDANLSQQQMTFYLETIASDSVRLLPLLQNNSEAMKEQAKRAKELGVGLDDIDVAQAMAAEKALSDASVEMDAALKKATVAIAPFITEILKQFGETNTTVEDFAVIIGDVMDYAGKAVGVFVNGVHGIRVIFAGLEVVARGVIFEMAKGFDVLANGSVREMGRAIVDFVFTPLRSVLEILSTFSDTAKDALSGFDSIVNDIFGKPKEGLGDFAKAQQEALDMSINAFNTLATQQLPSESVDAWVARVKEGVEQAAEETRKTVADTLNLKNEKDSGDAPDMAENTEALKLHEETEAIIEALADRYRLQEEGSAAYYERINAAIDAAEKAGTITKQQASDARNQIAEDERDFNLQLVKDTMDGAITLLSVGGKKAQKIAQKLAVARAIVSGGEAAVHAWDAGMLAGAGTPYAPLIAAAYTAVSLAKTGAMISSLRSSGKVSSSGGGAAPSIPSASSSSSSSSQSQQSSSRNIQIGITGGSMFGAEQIRELIGQINEQVGDGVTLATTG